MPGKWSYKVTLKRLEDGAYEPAKYLQHVYEKMFKKAKAVKDLQMNSGDIFDGIKIQSSYLEPPNENAWTLFNQPDPREENDKWIISSTNGISPLSYKKVQAYYDMERAMDAHRKELVALILEIQKKYADQINQIKLLESQN